MTEMWRQVLRWTKIALGFGLIILAFILGFVPGLAGFPLALVGLAMLATEFRWAKKANRFIKMKCKNTVARFKARRAEKKIDESRTETVSESDR